MLKLIGAAFVLLFGVALARYLAASERKRVALAEGMLDFVRYIRAEIDCFCPPRRELFAGYKNEVLEGNGFLPALRKTEDIGEALGMCTASRDPALTDLMRAFDRELGKSYREEQLVACDYYASRLADLAAGAREALPAKIKVRRTVCLSGALLVILLLL